MGTAINTDTGLFSPTATGVTIAETGIYKVEASLYQTTTAVSRSNVSIEFAINGTSQGVVGASGYIRRSGGHNESSSHLSQILNVSAGQNISVLAKRLAASGTITTSADKSVLIVTRIK